MAGPDPGGDAAHTAIVLDRPGAFEDQPVAPALTRAFLERLRELVAARVKDGDLSAEDWAAAIRLARAHAGGVSAAARRLDHAGAIDRAGATGETTSLLPPSPFAEPWVAEVNLADLCARPTDWALLCELAEFADAPEWIPLLPKPGRYKHARYGAIAITPERTARFIENFAGGIYQKPLPVNAEHQTVLGGAMGWIVDLRQNADGSADARVEWTDRGRKMLAEERFKFVSPEWWTEWRDPLDDTIHTDVLSGAALTVRPFFKPKSLRPLLAREGALFAAREISDDLVAFDRLEAGEEEPVTEETTAQTTPEATPTVSPEQFAEVLAANQALAERLQTMERDARARRFAEEAEGRGAASGLRWFGDVEKHVGFMEALASEFGEDSEELKHYITINRAFAEQTKASNLYSQKGVVGDGSPAPSAAAEIDRRAKALAAERGLATFSDAVAAVAAEDPRLYARYRREVLAHSRTEEE
ncbi:MAG: phage protease [Dehalococcoidia bacterium]